MTMPSDADKAVENVGSNDGPRESADTGDKAVYIDEQNVPHPSDDIEMPDE
ncbi:MAG: hypothetical protein WBF79_05865 [Rhodococcus sp. (in: high G+C Gram-positive bacteria)]